MDVRDRLGFVDHKLDTARWHAPGFLNHSMGAQDDRAWGFGAASQNAGRGTCRMAPVGERILHSIGDTRRLAFTQ